MIPRCFQCLREVPDYPVVLIVSYAESLREFSVGLSHNGKYLAMPYCSPCHHHPTQKGHFFYSADKDVALERAGSMNLG